MIRAASNRIQASTADETNEQIYREMEQRLSYYAAHPDQIDQRLWDLDREWDIERTVQTGAAGLSLTGMILGTIRARRWFLLPAAVAGFVMQHALQGYSPALPLLRGFGVRTRGEIEQERYALKVLRGDFRLADLENKPGLEKVAAILDAVMRK
jgi:hypothetical protein